MEKIPNHNLIILKYLNHPQENERK
ncbi:hypothetical protein NPIRD3C_1299 [Nitrosopumilus piranensis]|uniref:Uncharacterized protein n=1 Tax=Nitrosopumilus piranensis TaxID=1582439 RepID=A0A0C5BW68_9ARCH|nr:hypothetical protein NPIRD3C_1299 [Nitrosopumilus piranensis]